MDRFVSIAVFRRDGKPTFLPPRREIVDSRTQARKAAARHWQAAIKSPDILDWIIVVERDVYRVIISDRSPRSRAWTTRVLSPAELTGRPHLAACLTALGVDPAAGPAPLPDVITINGFIYRRDRSAEEI